MLVVPVCEITLDVLDRAWNEFVDCKPDDKLTWLRSWLGKFNYFRSYISHDHENLEALSLLQDMLKIGDQEKFDAHIGDCKEAFLRLGRYCMFDLPLVSLGQSRKVYATILIIDANSESWGSCLLKAVESESNDPVDEDMKELYSVLNLGLPFELIPVGLHGQMFSRTQRRMSSTYRERSAILQAVDYLYTQIESGLYVVCDNRNVSLHWNDELFSGREITMYHRALNVINRFIWIRRNGVPRFADWLARAVARGHDSKDSESDMPSLIAIDASDNNVTDIRSPTPDPADEREGEDELQNMGLSERLKFDLIRGYRNDLTSVYHQIPLNLIYKFLSGKQGDLTPDEMKPKVELVAKRFVLDDDLLKFRAVDGLKIVVPVVESDAFEQDGSQSQKALRLILLHYYHDKYLHTGIFRLLRGIMRFWYWPKLQVDARAYIRACVTCNVREAKKNHLTPGNSSLGEVTENSRVVFDELMIDYCSINGFNVLLVICCYSHFLFVHVDDDNNADALSTARGLYNILCYIGVPSQIFCDNGTHFVNDVIENLGKLFGFSLNRSTPYNPRRNGLVETTVKEIKRSLSSSERGEGMDVSHVQRFVNLAAYIHNTSQLSYAPLSPYEIVFGRKANDPLLPADFGGVAIHDTFNVRQMWDHLRDQRFSDIHVRHDISHGDGHSFQVDDDVVAKVGPHVFVSRIIMKSGENHWVLNNGEVVSENQLRYIPKYNSDERELKMQFNIGDVVMFRSYAAGDPDVVDIDVGQVVSTNNNLVNIRRFFCDQNNCWIDWGDYFVEISINDIMSQVNLTKEGRIPKEIM